MHGLRLAVVGLLVGAALGIHGPRQKIKAGALEREFQAPSPPAPVSTACKSHINQTDCHADKCCAWCGPNATLPVPIGWCMPVLPVATSLICDKKPSMCQINVLNTTCLADPQCKWLPTNPITGAGSCMYNWDACDVPVPAPAAPTFSKTQKQAARARLARKASKLASATKTFVAPGPSPVPKLNCTIPTAEECDAAKCCQWCGSAWNTTAPGWCMPVLDEPIPMMTCSKGSHSCSSLAPAACNMSDTCSWMPFGPPTSTMGVCVFDWKKCTAPAPPP